MSPASFPVVRAESRPLVTVGYSVVASRAKELDVIEPNEQLEVLVVVQDGTVDPPRAGVRVIEQDSLGVAKSRNAVLEHACGRYVVFADDDSAILQSGLERIISYLQCHPEVALVLGQSVDAEGRPRKRSPGRVVKLSRWNSARAGTIELVVDRDAFKSRNVRFDESFGAGTRNFLGDEYIFISDAVRAGLTCVALPVPVGVHPAESSGTTFGTAADARARSEVFARVFGSWAVLPRSLFAVRHARDFGSFAVTARFVVGRFDD